MAHVCTSYSKPYTLPGTTIWGQIDCLKNNQNKQVIFYLLTLKAIFPYRSSFLKRGRAQWP